MANVSSGKSLGFLRLPVVSFALALMAVTTLQYRHVERLDEARRHEMRTEEGSSPPAFSVERLDGGSLDPSSLKGRLTVVAFWASWCMPCQLEMPEIADFAAEWNGTRSLNPKITVVAINVGEEPWVSRDMARDPRYRDVVFTLDYDRRAADLWEVEQFPTSIVVGPNGSIIGRVTGYRERPRIWLSRILSKVVGAGVTSQ